jgi:hypothetical protein
MILSCTHGAQCPAWPHRILCVSIFRKKVIGAFGQVATFDSWGLLLLELKLRPGVDRVRIYLLTSTNPPAL